MSWPAAINTVLLTVGRTHDAPGNNLDVTLTVEADLGGPRSITWAATNDTMTTLVGRAKDELAIPVVDQAGWVAPSGLQITEWGYRAQLVIRSHGQTRVLERRFKLRTGQLEVDFFDLPADEVATPVFAPTPAVTSVNGQTGAVIVEAGEGAREYPQPLSNTWFVQHNLGRRPLVQLIVNDEQVFTRTIVTDTTVTATFPNPTTGDLVLA